MRLLLIVTVVVLAAGACGGDGDEETEAADPADGPVAEDEGPPYSVERSVVTFTDESRPTPGTPGAPARPGRELETHLYEPVGDGPFPLIVFAHGLNGHPRKFTRLHEAWAEAGYVVAAPVFPVSNDEAPGGGEFIDLGEQPGDMTVVLDRLLGADSPLGVEVDEERIGSGGLSLGGGTVYGHVYDDCCRDDRITAAMVLDGNAFNFEADLDRGPPLIVVHAVGDPALPYAPAAESFAAATVPAGLLTLNTDTHAEPFEDTVDPADELVAEVLLAWWDAHLGGDPAALERIPAAVDGSGSLAVWESKAL